MKKCEVDGCDNSSFGKDRNTGIRYCKFHQYLRSDTKPSPVKRKSLKTKNKHVILDGTRLKETDAFKKAHKYCKGEFFLVPGKFIKLEDLRAWNCAHVLSKNKFKYFRYYWKNIVIMTLDQHEFYDKKTVEDIYEKRIKTGLESSSRWKELLRLRKELIEEYKEWVKNNPHQYRV